MGLNKNRQNKGQYQITKEGSLGLLALGDIGLREWRKLKKKRNGSSEE